MNRIRRNIKIAFFIYFGLFAILVGYFSYALLFYGDRWFANSYNSRVRMDTSQPKIILGDILDRNGKKLVTTVKEKRKNPETGEMQDYYYRSYQGGSGKARNAAHVVGFHHPSYGRAGAEAFHIRYLMGYNNNLLERIYQKAFMAEERGNDIALTIDLELQRYADEVLGKNKGSAVILNTATGEILAMVSHPTFDPNAMEVDSTGDQLFNRAAEGLYPPGSIFKIITAASALENMEDLQHRSFDCEGFVEIDGETIPCYGRTAHGKVDIIRAMSVSCNGMFSQLGVELGARNLLKTGEAFGFNDEFLFSDIKVAASKLPLKAGMPDSNLGWSAIGQDEVLVTPLHMAMVAASIANDGVMMEPKLLYGVIGRNDRVLKRLEPRVYKTPVSPENASILKTMMESVVIEGTGTRAMVKGMGDRIAGKTGTAEKRGSEDIMRNDVWFIGYAPAENPSVTIALVVEDANEGETGGNKAAPLAGQILRKARELGY